MLACALLPGVAAANHALSQAVPASATFLGISDNGEHVFHDGTLDYANGTNTNIAPGATNAGIVGFSADGARVIFQTTSQLSPADTDTRVDLYEYVGGVRTLLSVGSSGGNGAIDVQYRGTNADATHVYFTTTEQLEPGDTDAALDLYERVGGSTNLLSVGPFGGNSTGSAEFGGSSADGTRVFFSTSDQLTSDDMDARPDVYENSGGTVTRKSLGPIGGNANLHSFYAGNTPDGSKVFFQTRETMTTDDLDDENRDTYVRDGSTTTLLSTGPLPPSAAIAEFKGASTDGTRAVFVTNEPLVVEDVDIRNDVYLREGGTTTLLSIGPAGGNADNIARFEGMSTDATRVFFSTPESLVAADTDEVIDIYEHSGGTLTLVSTSATDPNSFRGAIFNGLSDNGSRVFFTTDEQLVPEDTDTASDIYERFGGVTYLVPYPDFVWPAFKGTSANGEQVVISAGGPLILATLGTGYVRPKGAVKTSVSLVPAYAECTSPDLVHGPPLEHGSCSSPQQLSSNLTVGSPDANGSPANSVSFVRFSVLAGVAGPPEDSDVEIEFQLTDVLCRPGVATCGPANAGGEDDYVGELQLNAGLRITDRLNDGGDPATVQDSSFPVTVPCAATAATDRGGSCLLLTTANAVLPGSVLDSQRAIWALDGVQVLDGGADGDAETAGDNGLFAKQGLFVP